MRYAEHPPPPALRDEVVCLWVLEHDPRPGAPPETIVPDGRAELVFNLGTPYRDLNEPADRPQPRAFVVGQIRRALHVVPVGRVSILGVRLEPTALHGLLGAPMVQLTDRSVDVRDLGRPDLVELEARLRDEAREPRRLELVRAWLLARLRPRRDGTRAALELLRRSRGHLDAGEVARRVGWSARTLDRRFAERVGLTPKTFARQVRLQHVFELLGRSPRPTWTEIAHASGCYDQAHLNREFRTFTGRSPAAFLRERHDLSDRLTGLA